VATDETGSESEKNVVEGLGLPAFALLAAIGLALIGYGGWSFGEVRAFRSGADQVAGTYVNQRKRGDDEFVVTVALPGEGGTVEHEFTVNHDYMRGRLSTDPIPVLVSRDTPSDMRLATSGSLSPLVFGAIGLGLIGLGAAGALHRLRNRSSL